MAAYITVGAKKTYGGTVISGSSQTTHNGIPTVQVGDKVICKKCKKITTMSSTISKYLITLSTCTPNAEVSHDKLSDAYLNQSYEASIKISDGTVVELGFYSETSDDNFKITPSTAKGGYKDYNLLTVTGTPTISEPIHIYIAGDSYRINFLGE